MRRRIAYFVLFKVRYEVDGNERVFDWQQVEAVRDHLNNWDVATHAGSITATIYNNGQKVC